MKKELRPHQVTAMQMLKQSLSTGHRRPLLQAPTGFGKTVISAAIAEGALSKGNRVIFCVPAISLINQTVQSFYSEGLYDVGVIQSNHELTDYTKPLQIASVQTLAKRQIPHADVVVIDEAHRWFKFYSEWMSKWDSTPFIGLSATPWTKGLGKHYDDLLIAATTQNLIDTGYLSDFTVFIPSKPDLSKVRTVAGDWHEGDLGEAMDKPELVADIVTNWLQHGEGRPTLCFAVSRAHAKSLQRDFIAAGINAGYIDAFTDIDEREQIRKAFHTGDIQVVCNVGCLTTGVDWDVRCIILARPTKSEMLFVQIIGRGLRTAEGKDQCLIFDHSDTHTRLGCVTDIHHETLNTGKEKKSASQEREKPLPKDCPSCGFLKAPRVHACPNCGFAPEKQSEVKVEKGELVELKRKKKLNKEASPEEKKRFYGELKFWAEAKGYAPEWASNKYREKFGVWPNAHGDAPMMEPSMHTINWIKSRQIAWAKSKKRSA